MKTIVTKFGGTSLADAEQFRKVRDIIRENPARRFVVASAPGKRFSGDIKVTDLLLKCFELASQGEDFSKQLTMIQERFQNIARELELSVCFDDEMETLREHLLHSPRKAYVASRGEYFNSRILAEYLGYTFVDPAWCISFHEDGTPDMDMTMRTMRAALLPLKNAVIAGFYGADGEGVIHTFSRGGSDVTGSLVARAINADLYENWTDVSGLLAADPRIVPNPRSVEYMTYRELRTLSYMGFSVLHTDAVLPAAAENIPINIRNTNRPQDAGTMIVRELPANVKCHAITGIAGLVGMSVIQVEKVMVSDGAGFTAVLLDILKQRGIPFEQCLTGIDTVTLVIKSSVLEPCKNELLEEIQKLLKPDHMGIMENLSMIAVIGGKDVDDMNANVCVLNALSKENIAISTINQGAGKLNLLLGVSEECYEKAIRTIYSAFEDR